MPDDRYGFEKFTDREILILTAQRVHDLLEAKEDHVKRIEALERWQLRLHTMWAVVTGGIYLLRHQK